MIMGLALSCSPLCESFVVITLIIFSYVRLRSHAAEDSVLVCPVLSQSTLPESFFVIRFIQ